MGGFICAEGTRQVDMSTRQFDEIKNGWSVKNDTCDLFAHYKFVYFYYIWDGLKKATKRKNENNTNTIVIFGSDRWSVRDSVRYAGISS